MPGGKVFELGGKETKTFRELLELMLRTIERRRLLVPLPWFAARAIAAVAQYLPGALVTPDQVRQLMLDNVVSAAATRDGRTLRGLGIDATSLEAILESYLYRFREHGEFDRPKPVQGQG